MSKNSGPAEPVLAASEEVPKAVAMQGPQAEGPSQLPLQHATSCQCKVRAGILCFREVPPAGDGSAAVEILLVSRRSRTSASEESSPPSGKECHDTFTVPAGKFEAGVDGSFEDCAIREAHEEAGIVCERVADLGWFSSQSKRGEPIQTRYFLGRRLEELDTWQEVGQRDRVWLPPAEALAKASYRPDLAAVVQQGIEAIDRHRGRRPSFGNRGGGLSCVIAKLCSEPPQPPRKAASSGYVQQALSAVVLSDEDSEHMRAWGVDADQQDEGPLLKEIEGQTSSRSLGSDAPQPARSVRSCSKTSTAVEGAASDKLQQDAEERFVFYQHQVGGHFCLVKPAAGCNLEVESGGASGSAGLKDNYIVQGSRVLLKPFDEAEFLFYLQLPEKRETAMLLPFTARFYGSKTLRREQMGSLGQPSPPTSPTSREQPPAPSPPMSPTSREKMKKAAFMDDKAASFLHDKAAFWEAKWSSHNIRKYIVLEDLSYMVHKPCVMDLKMGCRQRSARHSVAKRSKMAQKAMQTTSAALGFRVCGMQCYDREAHSLKFYDKYWGQRVAFEAMSRALSIFLLSDVRDEEDCGRRELWEALLRRIIEMLSELRRVVQELPGLRFWSGSLLLGFDAAYFEQGRREELLSSVQLKMIDFAHFSDVGGDRPDEEYLCGVDNFRAHLEAQLQGSATDVQAWLQKRLVPPPPSAPHDEEEIGAHKRLQQASSDRGSSERGTSAPPKGEDNFVENFLANGATISGATGLQMVRELATNHIVWSNRGK